MTVRPETRAAVLSAMSKVGRDAKTQGIDPWAAIRQAVPEAPYEVVAEAWLSVEDEATEAWWDKIEKTIDGEIVRQTLHLQKK